MEDKSRSTSSPEITLDDGPEERSSNSQVGSEASYEESEASSPLSLQESFLEYKKRRQEQIRQAKKLKEKKVKDRADPKLMQILRNKFVEQAKKYFGTPYAKKYWKKEEAEYKSTLFLDCCGLVRRVMRDLEADFGFHLGPWNQAYQFDTLPITIEKKEDMKPGDLVFIAATYVNPKSRKQKHDMVHVEIWLGDGDKTIGARWQRGKVQVHDSYDFEAKSYHSPTYIFKSLDTWLMGICQSYCDMHRWRLPSEYDPTQKSIFYSDSMIGAESTQLADVNASDTEEDEEDEEAVDCDEKPANTSNMDNVPPVTEVLVSETTLSVAENFNSIDKNQHPGITVPETPVTYSFLASVTTHPATTISVSPYIQETAPETIKSISRSEEAILPPIDSRHTLLVATSEGRETINIDNQTSQQEAYNEAYTSSDKHNNPPSKPAQEDVSAQQGVKDNSDGSGKQSDDSKTSLCDELTQMSVSDVMHELSSTQVIRSDNCENASEESDNIAEPREVTTPECIIVESRKHSTTSDIVCVDGLQMNLCVEGSVSESDQSSPEQSSENPAEVTVLDRTDLCNEDLTLTGPGLLAEFAHESDSLEDTEITELCESVQNPISSTHEQDYMSHQEKIIPSQLCRSEPADPHVRSKNTISITPVAVTSDTKRCVNPSYKASPASCGSRAKPSSYTAGAAVAVSPSRSKSGGGTEPKKLTKKAEHNARIRSLSIPTNCGMASYQICGGNGGPIVDAYLSSLGWKKIPDKQNFNWKLKWVEVNSQINYGAFRDGEQLVNRIPNCSLLTNKLGLFNSLSEYSRVMGALKGDRCRMKMTDFVPETYRIDQIKDREQFLDIYKDGEIWICKPTGLNQGKGIFLIRSRDAIDKMLADREQRKQARRTKPLMALIVQRYIERPLLVEKKKFDIRSYMIISSTIPFMVFYHKGYVRVTCEEYELDSFDLSLHLTNQFVQKKNENYKDRKEDTVWSMDRFNQYVNDTFAEEKGLEKDWVLNYVEKQIKSIMKYCFNSVKHKLQSRMGLFDIYGLDFMIDENMKMWLIEINVNPAMHTNCDVLKETLPDILEQTIDTALECFEKTKKNQPILPLQSARTFQILYNGCPKSSGQATNSATDSQSSSNINTGGGPTVARSSQSPVRSQAPIRRSASPSKDQGWGYISRSPVKSSKQSHSAEHDSRGAHTSGNPGSSIPRGAQPPGNPGSSVSRLTQSGSNSNIINNNVTTSKPEPKPIVGTNYIKSNIANLGTISQRRRARIHRLERGPAVATADELDAPNCENGANQHDYTELNSSATNGTVETDNPYTDEIGETEPSQAVYNKHIPNAAPVGPQQVSARARGTTPTPTSGFNGSTQQIFSAAGSQQIAHTDNSRKSTEQILRELKEFRPRTPLLPPLYTIRSDVATSRVIPSSSQVVAVGAANPEIALQGYPAISNSGADPSNSPVRLCMVHAAYAPGKARARNSPAGSFTTVSRKYPRDRAS